METLKFIFDPSFKITISTIISIVLWILLLLIIRKIIKGKRNFELVKAELSITNAKLYYELNKDKEKEYLILENGRLKEEIKTLQKQNSKLSLFSLIILVFTIINIAFKGEKRLKKKR